MANIALIAMSGKPFHKGHMHLIKSAAKENDIVKVFVSTSDRIKKGEAPIYGKDMEYIWNRYIEDLLPANVNVTYGGSPITNLWKVLGDANEMGTTDKFFIYSDPEDMSSRFPDNQLKKYAGELYDNKRIVLKPIKRAETSGISGTALRKALQTDDYKTFADGMPTGLNVKEVWDLLKSSAGKSTQKNESIIKSYIRLLINNE